MKGLHCSVWIETLQRHGYLFKPSVSIGTKIAHHNISVGLQTLCTPGSGRTADPSERILTGIYNAYNNINIINIMPITESNALFLLPSLNFSSSSLGIAQEL